MKQMKKMSVVLACALCLQAPAMPAAAAAVQTAETESMSQAAVKQGLLRENGKYYYYNKGRKLKNRWIVLNRGGKYYKWYLGKDGAAYAGKKVKIAGETLNAHKVAKIGGAYYGFDCYGHMLKGTYVIDDRLYVFSSKDGKMNRTVSNKLRRYCKYGSSTTTLKKILKNIGQKPLKVEKYPGCYGDDGFDMVYNYKNFQISAFKEMTEKRFSSV